MHLMGPETRVPNSPRVRRVTQQPPLTTKARLRRTSQRTNERHLVRERWASLCSIWETKVRPVASERPTPRPPRRCSARECSPLSEVPPPFEEPSTCAAALRTGRYTTALDSPVYVPRSTPSLTRAESNRGGAVPLTSKRRSEPTTTRTESLCHGRRPPQRRERRLTRELSFPRPFATRRRPKGARRDSLESENQ